MRRGQVRRFHRNEPAQKEKITPKTLEITVEGILDTPTLQPGSHFRSFNVIYNLECDTIEEQSIVGRAVTQAQEKVLRHRRHAAQDSSRRSRDIDRQHRNDEGLILPAE